MLNHHTSLDFKEDDVNMWPRVFLSFFAENTSKEPALYSGRFSIDSEVKDTFISFKNWGKGIAFVNDFNIGRYWPVNY